MMGQTAFLLVCLGMMGAMWYFHQKSWIFWLMTNLFAFGFAAATMLVWQALETGPGGIGSDAWFNTAIVVKQRAGMGNGDFAYKGLHAFYPSLYQLVVGKLAALTHTPGLKAMKYGFYWAAFLLPLVSYGLWRKLLPALPAFLMMVLSMTIARENLSFKTFEVISVIIFLPWALYYVVGLRLREAEGEASWSVGVLERKEWIAGGLIAGLSFMTFYYYFFLLILWLPLQVVIASRSEGLANIWAKFRPMLLMFLVMMALSAVYWAPLLGDMMRYGMHSYQNRWFQPHMLEMPFDIMNNWRGMLGLVGLLALAPRNALARSVLVMMVAVTAYVLLGHLGLYNNFPLLHVRMLVLDEYLLSIGMIMGVLKLLSLVPDFVQKNWDKAFAVTVATVFAMSIAMVYNYESNNDLTNSAKSYKQPQLLGLAEFTPVSRGKVFLTNRLELAALRPLYLFICPNAHYTHPASRYRERLKLLTLLQHSKDSDFIAWMLQHNRYDRVDMIILDDNRMELFDDNFPDWPNHLKIPIEFDSTAFKGRFFSQHPQFGELKVAEEVPVELWKGFNQGQMRFAALFSDIPELRSRIPGAEMKLLDDEVRIQTKDYTAWQRAFWARWMGGW